MMNGNDYQREAMRTNKNGATSQLYDISHLHLALDERVDFIFGDMINAALGLTGESGEVADMIKKWIFHDHNLDVGHLEKELGDVMWYVALMCHAIGTDMDSIMEKNIAKLKARYPDGFDPERSQNRKAGDV